MESIKNHLFSSNTCHRINPSIVPSATEGKTLQDRITFVKETDGKIQSYFDESIMIEVPNIETSKKISDFWKHQKYLANIQTSAFFGVCITSVVLVSRAILLPYSLIAAITFVASGIFALNKKRNAEQQIQLYSSPTITYAKELDQTRQKLLKATFAELCQKSKADSFFDLVNKSLHPKEIQLLFRQDLEKLLEAANALNPVENSQNEEMELSFYKTFFDSPLFSEKALKMALIPIEKASYISQKFSKLLSVYRNEGLLTPPKNPDEKIQKLKTILYLKKEIELLLNYANQKELFTSTLGKLYSSSNKTYDIFLQEKKWQQIKKTIEEGNQTAVEFYHKAKKESESCLGFLKKNAKICKAKSCDFYRKESERLKPHIAKGQQELATTVNLVKTLAQKKLTEKFSELKKTLNRDSLFSKS